MKETLLQKQCLPVLKGAKYDFITALSVSVSNICLYVLGFFLSNSFWVKKQLFFFTDWFALWSFGALNINGCYLHSKLSTNQLASKHKVY